PPRPDTLMQTGQVIVSKPLANGARHTFFKRDLLALKEAPHRGATTRKLALAHPHRPPRPASNPAAPQSASAKRSRTSPVVRCCRPAAWPRSFQSSGMLLPI